MQIWTIEEITSSSKCRHRPLNYTYIDGKATFKCDHMSSKKQDRRFICVKENCPLKVVK